PPLPPYPPFPYTTLFRSSLHPLGALELIAPHLFGNYYDAFLADMPWMSPLNSGRDPFYYPIYLGPIVLALAGAGLAARPRRNVRSEEHTSELQSHLNLVC